MSDDRTDSAWSKKNAKSAAIQGLAYIFVKMLAGPLLESIKYYVSYRSR